jgi:hypothetical protein
MRMRWTGAAIAVLMLAISAAARPGRPMPLQLRIEAFVGAPAPAVTALAHWTVSVSGKEHTLTVMKLQPIGADVAYWTILNALEPLPVAMTIVGPAALRRELTHTPPGQLVALRGAFELRRGPSMLLLSGLEPLGTPIPVPTPGAMTAATPAP